METNPANTNICRPITFVQRRPNVFDVDPTLYKCHTNVCTEIYHAVVHLELNMCHNLHIGTTSTARLSYPVGEYTDSMAKRIRIPILKPVQDYSHTHCRSFLYETYIGISLYHTLCRGFHYETYIGISLYHTLCCGFLYEMYIIISLYHTLCCGFHYETYIGINPYHTLCRIFTMRCISVSAYITLCAVIFSGDMTQNEYINYKRKLFA